MRINFKLTLTVLFSISIAFSAGAQNNFFAPAAESSIRIPNAKRVIVPQRFHLAKANTQQLKNFLWSLPSENELTSRSAAPVMELPMPDGNVARFRVWESSIQEPGLESKFPEIKTFSGQGIDDPYATIRMDYNPYFGFHAQVLSINGRVYIDPYARGNIDYYMSYNHADNNRITSFSCGTDADPVDQLENSTSAKLLAGPCRGTQLYTYRLAVACTGEYAQAVGGTTAPALHAAIVTTVNRVTGVYEKELTVKLILVANNNVVEFLDPTTDPFNGNNSSGILIGESQSVIDNNIGSAAYDVGHTFSTGGGGLATLNSVCNGSTKARGITGSPSPVGDGYDIDYVAHEMGHQFGGSHSFNSVTSQCNGNRSASAAYEVGSGTTIQGYAGICASDNIQPNSDPYFHAISFDQISAFLENGGSFCRTVVNTSNNLPVITAMDNNGVTIPFGTPFTLNATATDADGDALTYNWEQWDLGTAGAWNSGANSTTAPLFKSRIPKSSGSRTFPDIAVILAGYPANPGTTMGGLKGETLPQVARVMKFKLTVRDNRAGGGAIVTGGDGCQAGLTGLYQINVAGTGPFNVTVPNGGESYPGGTVQNITWNVAGTNAAPINTANVKISLSTDGGLTYPTVLITSTPNDGSEPLPLPSILTNTARVKVEAVGNVYFDISNANFNITAAASGFEFSSPAAASVACGGPASTTITLGTTSNGGFTTPINLVATGNPAGTTVSFSNNPLTPGSSTDVTINGLNTLPAGTYNVTIGGTAGSVVKTRLLVFTIQAGTPPAINTQPVPQTVCVGNTALFTVSGTGTTYQWQLSTDGGNNFTDIAGATSATYSTSAATAGMNNNRYRVLVLTQCGIATSNAVILTVNTPPAISSQPQSTSLCLGSNASFNVTVNGANPTYQWQVSTDGGANYTNISGATAAGYTANNITTGMNNNRYRVIVSGTCAPSATSADAILTVVQPVSVTTDASSTTICETGNVSFTVAGSSTLPVGYQWQVSTDGGANWTNVTNNTTYSGATTATLNVNNVASSMNNYRYRALLSNTVCTAGTPSNATTPAVLTVNARPTVTLSANPTSIMPGMTTTINANIQPSATGFNISWFRNGTLIPGATGTSYTVDVTGLGDYRVDIVNTATGCNNTSNILSITASPSPRLFIFPIPNNGRFTIAYYNSGGNTSRNVIVYDARGALVFQKLYAINSPYQLLAVDMKAHAAGIYLVVLTDASGKKVATGKMMIGRH